MFEVQVIMMMMIRKRPNESRPLLLDLILQSNDLFYSFLELSQNNATKDSQSK